ncbi:hypothetical protein EJ110_NYTH53660 [Nymphaea thermarum]|nr:hypothetical protein EJ110_NYTH53660 [Nymphaea thermarum]
MEAGSTGTKKASAISRCIKALSPAKALCRARDFYVRSMLGCAGKVAYADMGYSGVPNLPRSFSNTSSRGGHDDEDMRELVRIASLRASRRKANDGYQQSAGYRPPAVGAARVPRSYSVHIPRIDEDKPCSFGEKGGEDGIFSRSRSYAPHSRNRFAL